MHFAPVFKTPYRTLAHKFEQAKFFVYKALTGKEHPEAFFQRVCDDDEREDALHDETNVLPFDKQVYVLIYEHNRRILNLMFRRKDIKPEYDKIFNRLCYMAMCPEGHPFSNNQALDILADHPELFDKTRIIKVSMSELDMDIEENPLRKGFLVNGKVRSMPKSLNMFQADHDGVEAFFVMRQIENDDESSNSIYFVVRNIDEFDLKKTLDVLGEWFDQLTSSPIFFEHTRGDFKKLEAKMMAVFGGELLAKKHGVANSSKTKAGL